MACSSPPSAGELGLPAPEFTSHDWPARCSLAPATSCRLSRSRSCSRRAVPSTPSSGPASTLPAVRGSPIANPVPRRPHPSVARDPPTTYATMVGSTAAPPPSPHRACPTEILDGGAVPPPPPSRVEATVSPSVPLLIGAVVSSPSTLARAAATKNKGHASIEEVAAAATLCALYPVTQDPHQGNQYQTKSKRYETFDDFFLDKRDPGSFGRSPEEIQGDDKATGRA